MCVNPLKRSYEDVKPNFHYFFDFDETLTVCLVEATYMSSEQNKNVRINHPQFFYEHCFGGAERIAVLKDFLNHLLNQGAKLSILSLCNEEEIRNALSYVGLNSYFTDIYDRFRISRYSSDPYYKIDTIRKVDGNRFFFGGDTKSYVCVFIDNEARHFDLEKSVVVNEVLRKIDNIYLYHATRQGLDVNDIEFLKKTF